MVVLSTEQHAVRQGLQHADVNAVGLLNIIGSLSKQLRPIGWPLHWLVTNGRATSFEPLICLPREGVFQLLCLRMLSVLHLMYMNPWSGLWPKGCAPACPLCGSATWMSFSQCCAVRRGLCAASFGWQARSSTAGLKSRGRAIRSHPSMALKAKSTCSPAANVWCVSWWNEC